MVQRLEKTEIVKTAVDANRIVVACAYNGHVHEDVKAALPQGFQARQYVARFVDGRLAGVEIGKPEEVITRLLDEASTECKSCDGKTCKDCAAPAIP